MYPNLKLAIFKRGLHQNYLAREVGIHAVALSKIIRGFREPSPAQRSLLCKYLGAEESWLFEKYTFSDTQEQIPQTDSQEGKNGDS
jgi:transcriptional regulator with XRE-family HTH domain